MFAWVIACLSNCKHGGCAVFPDCLRVFWCGEEEVAIENEIEEDVIFFSALRLLMRREISRIRGYFEVTVPVYELDVFRSHFRMTRTTFEFLAQMIILSEHIQNGNALGRPVVEPDKQIAMALWIWQSRKPISRYPIALMFN